MRSPSAILAALAVAFAVCSPAWADAPLAARAQDPEGWWKGRVYARTRLPFRAIEPGAVGGLVLSPMPADAEGALLDHAGVDPALGTAAELNALIDRAHRANVAVLIALSPNHVAETHPWFVAAESGDRLAQDAFVWADAAPAGQRWRESGKAGRWYYRARGGPDLDLRHRVTRARVVQAAKGWIERGADGLVLSDVRYLFEDGAGAELDRPESVAFVRELADGVRAMGGAVIGVEVDGDAAVAARYLGGASFAIHTGPPASLVLPGTRLVGEGALLESDLAFVALEDVDRLAPLLAARQKSVALSLGATVPMGGAAILRQLGKERALVTRAPGAIVRVPLAPLVEGVATPDLKGGKAVIGEAGAWRVDPVAAPWVVRFGRPQAASRGLVIDLGLRFDDARGVGFSRDVERSTRCSPRRCAIGADDARLEWHFALPVGAYDVEVEREGDERATLLAEGLPMAPHKRGLRASVFVRDGKLTLASTEPGVKLAEVRVAPARSRAVAPKIAVSKDRLTITADGPGVVEWRMNGSRVEPVELAPLEKQGASWTAVLGPWPSGAVQRVGLVIRGADGAFVTADGGRELEIAVE